MKLGINEIQQIIPHRHPFLMIDKVIELIPNEKLVAIKNVSINEGFFVGHFPEEKIMPGVLIIEAMAQAACIYYYYSKEKMGKKLIYYLGKTNVQFFEVVKPGDQVHIEIITAKLMDDTGFVRAKAFVESKKIAEGDILFGVREHDS